MTTPVARRAAWLAYTPPLTYRRAEGEDGTDLVPGLAEELPETSDDGRSYSFRLRPDLRYSNGKVLRASDFERAVARSLRLSPHGVALWGDIVGARAYARGKGDSTDVRGIAVNDRTGRVRIELESPDRLFRYSLASLAAAPVPRGTPLRDLSERPPPGIGPYRVAQVRRGGDVVLERRRDWRLPGVPAGNAQEIVTRTIAEPAARVDAVIDGRADLVEGESPVRMLPDIRSSYKTRYAEYPTLSTLYVSIDPSRAPFRDGDVRRALAYALDARVLAQLHDGFMQPTCNMLPPSVAGHQALDPCPYGERDGDADLVEASQLVEEAGATGANVRVAGGRDARGQRLARYLATTLRKIGLSARVVDGAGAQVGFATSTPAIPHPARLSRRRRRGSRAGRQRRAAGAGERPRGRRAGVGRHRRGRRHARVWRSVRSGVGRRAGLQAARHAALRPLPPGRRDGLFERLPALSDCPRRPKVVRPNGHIGRGD